MYYLSIIYAYINVYVHIFKHTCMNKYIYIYIYVYIYIMYLYIYMYSYIYIHVMYTIYIYILHTYIYYIYVYLYIYVFIYEQLSTSINHLYMEELLDCLGKKYFKQFEITFSISNS